MSGAAGGAGAPWLFSRRRDLLAFGGSALASLLLVALGIPLGLVNGSAPGARESPEWTWLVCVVLVDVAHVWGNLLLVYTDPVELRRRPALYAAVPAVGLFLGVLLASEGELVFWRALAALAVVHFVRQQVGWVKLYRGRNAEHDDGRLARIVDEGAVYAATLGPVLWWHAHLPRPFWWLATGDFFVALPGWAGTAALAVEAAWLALYGTRSVRRWRAGRGNPGKDLVVVTTALLWWLGIVALQSDYAFTVTNILIHGVPYMMLIAVVAERRHKAGVSLALPLRPAVRLGFVGVLLVLALCGVMEEGAWDRLLWHERAWLFPLPELDLGPLRWLAVPLLALPQLTHYILDGVLWRRREGVFS